MTWEAIYFISVVIIHVVLVGLIVVALLRGAGAEPIKLGARKMLRPSRAVLWSGWLFAVWAALGSTMMVEALGRTRAAASGLLVGFIVTLTFGLMAAWMLARYSRSRIVWDDEVVEMSNWKGEKKRYRWENLTGVIQRTGRNAVYGLEGDTGSRARVHDLELRFGDGEIVRAGPNMTGYYAFVSEVKERSPVHQQE